MNTLQLQYLCYMSNIHLFQRKSLQFEEYLHIYYALHFHHNSNL